MNSWFSLRYPDKKNYVSIYDYHGYPLTHEEVLWLLNRLTKEQIERGDE